MTKCLLWSVTNSLRKKKNSWIQAYFYNPDCFCLHAHGRLQKAYIETHTTSLSPTLHRDCQPPAQRNKHPPKPGSLLLFESPWTPDTSTVLVTFGESQTFPPPQSISQGRSSEKMNWVHMSLKKRMPLFHSQHHSTMGRVPGWGRGWGWVDILFWHPRPLSL